MREIKFRAWNPHDEVMITDGFVVSHYGILVVFNGDGKYPIMQYTGLKDKNGNEIYEGDILKVGVGGKEIVKYEDGGFKILNIYIGDGIKSGLPVSDVEIIGNIYENPELLDNK